MFPGTDHMTAVPLVNRSVDSDVIATRTIFFLLWKSDIYRLHTKKPSERVRN